MKKLIFYLVAFIGISAQALVAPEMYMVDNNCPKNAPFKRAYWHSYQDRDGGYFSPEGNCISCNTTKGLMLVEGKGCELCPNRTTHGLTDILSRTQCRLKKCPQEKPFYEEKWNWSGCKSCEDNPTHITKEECARCSNMRWVDGVNLCAPDKTGVIYYTGRILSVNGTEDMIAGGMAPYSYFCEYGRDFKALQTGRKECTHCPDTTFKNGWCYFNKQGKSDG